MTKRHDIYTSVTAQLIAAIEAGSADWRMPWHHTGTPVMRPTSVAGRRYTGINRLVLWATADALGYASGTWATFQQWKSAGGQVRKGQTGTHVILWKKVERADGQHGEDEGREGEGRARFFARGFCVFNRDQVDGIDPDQVTEVPPIEASIASALALLEGVGVPVDYGLHDAHYRPDLDKVFMPQRTAFDSDLDLVSTLAHEIAHSTGHSARLARETLKDYHKAHATRAREELVAEICAAMLMADLGLACAPRPDHAAYLTSWLTVLRNDPRAIFTAAAAAQAAADWIHQTTSSQNVRQIAA